VNRTTNDITAPSCAPGLVAYFSDGPPQGGDRTMTQTLDATIEQVETLYQAVTGKQAPPVSPAPYAEIPPEKDPEVHVGEQIERLLGSLNQVAARPIGLPIWTPPIWMCHGTDKLLVNVDLPGVPRDELRVRLSGGFIQVSGTRTPPVADGSRYAEQPFGAFQRWIPIPLDVSADQVKAQLKEGVLTIQAPRLGVAAAEGRDITVS
jgi:HSP20 family protein